MRRAVIVVAAGLLLSAGLIGGVIAYATTNNKAHVRGVVVFVGDSNMVGSAVATTAIVSNRYNGYDPVFVGMWGISIRSSECVMDCGSNLYWNYKLSETWAKINPDIIVSEIGINDTKSAGTETTPGYAYYSKKIDYFLKLIPSSKRVIWTTLPCTLEPSDRLYGCKLVNYALVNAPARWPNLIVLNWGQTAAGHPEYMSAPGTDVHYSDAGYAAWSQLVVNELDTLLPSP